MKKAALDISRLRAESGSNNAWTKDLKIQVLPRAAITFLDGEKGILRV